ncbi:MAG TPA: DUF4870 domain-containing protein [Nocardioidaceae bacterium]|jgi:uncharacterized Tic20 family protein|nr:DUF4870 domain-containing protein [Nocardioidaceae bacterium]
MSTPQWNPTSDLTPTAEERNWAMAAHLGSFVAAYMALGLLAPLLVLLVKGNASPYVRRHSVESLNFQITVLIWTAVAFVLAVVTLGFGLLVILPLAIVVAVFYVVVVVLASVRASGGRHYRYPLTMRLVS